MRFKDIVEIEFQQDYYKQLHQFVENEYLHKTIFPPKENIFRALNLCDYENVKVVILGQDPYHELHQANGLAFSVYPGVRIPPSLVNIYKELQDDLGVQPVQHGYLKHWADQGVLLLNSVLTVRDGIKTANTHRGHGWEQLTDSAIEKLSARPEPVIFILWGSAARSKIKLIDTQTNIVLQSPHPSPLSAYRGFFGSKPFSKTNIALTSLGETPIDWQLPQQVTISDESTSDTH